MRSTCVRRCCRRKAASRSEGAFFKKSGQDASFMTGGGEPLSADLNHFFSSRMGYDFSDVRIHTGKDAAESATDIDARAYTTGSDIVFNEGEYNMETSEGKKLMAHELTHVAQNGNGQGGNSINRKTSFSGKDKDDINLAEKYKEAAQKGASSSHVGVTIPFLNGKKLTDGTAKLKLPTEKDITTVQDGGKFKSSFKNLPDNDVTYEKHIPLKPSGKTWTITASADNFKSIIKNKCSGKDLSVYITGKPSNQAIINSVDAHESAHVTHLELSYNSSIASLDNNISKLTISKATEKESRRILMGALQGAVAGAFDNLKKVFEKNATDFHGEPAGKEASFSIATIDPGCMWIKSNVTI